MGVSKSPSQVRAEQFLRLLRNRMPTRHRYQWVRDETSGVFKEYRALTEKLDKARGEVEEKVSKLQGQLEEQLGISDMKKQIEVIAEKIEAKLVKARARLDEISIKIVAGLDPEAQIAEMLEVAKSLKLITE